MKISPLILCIICITFPCAADHGNGNNDYFIPAGNSVHKFIKKDHVETILFSQANSRCVKIRVPEKSIATDTEIILEEGDLVYDKKQFIAHGRAFRFGPKGLKFSEPARMTLPYTYEGPEEKFLNIYYLN